MPGIEIRQLNPLINNKVLYSSAQAHQRACAFLLFKVFIDSTVEKIENISDYSLFKEAVL